LIVFDSVETVEVGEFVVSLVVVGVVVVDVYVGYKSSSPHDEKELAVVIVVDVGEVVVTSVVVGVVVVDVYV